MITVFFSKQVKCPFNKKEVERLIKIAARREKKIKGEVEINVVGTKKITELNRVYRGINKSTDVLSFSWLEHNSYIKQNSLGQIFLCYAKIKQQAKEWEVPAKQELQRMLFHGLLHLVGYDHIRKKDAAKMFKLQEKLVSIAYK
jgi:probable rRNA maturation factor